MRALFLTSLLLGLTAPAVADSPWEATASHTDDAPVQVDRRTLSFDYSAGVDRHHLDGYTRVTGWRLGESWYFGKQRGGIGGLALVWQGDRDQMTVSTEGLRLIRRF